MFDPKSLFDDRSQPFIPENDRHTRKKIGIIPREEAITYLHPESLVPLKLYGRVEFAQHLLLSRVSLPDEPVTPISISSIEHAFLELVG